jgi:hypothetical protein
MRHGIGTWLINVLCGLLAYAGSRLIWGAQDTVLGKLHWELVTFAAFYLLLQALIRGWRLALRGKGRAAEKK